jgi:hypothetical protein
MDLLLALADTLVLKLADLMLCFAGHGLCC